MGSEKEIKFLVTFLIYFFVIFVGFVAIMFNEIWVGWYGNDDILRRFAGRENNFDQLGLQH